jgi:2,4-dienoyl-CoA reductase-like NADH-dependent reductase (Old Yellow Enzyme family)
VAPSPIAAAGHVSLVRPQRPHVVPRALELNEIPRVVAAYRLGAVNALRAGFDGVEIHGANGYLVDQFLQDGSNHRKDEYGGPVENRARFALEVTDAAISVWGADRVGYHIAPRGGSMGISDSDPAKTFGYLATQLGKRKIAFICARESLDGTRFGPALKKAFGGVYIVNDGFTASTADAVLANGEADAVAWGKLFIANPDLPKRLAIGAALNAPVPASFYGGDEKGYTDYPSMAA